MHDPESSNEYIIVKLSLKAHTHIHKYTHTHIHTPTHIYTHTYSHTHTHTYKLPLFLLCDKICGWGRRELLMSEPNLNETVE